MNTPSKPRRRWYVGLVRYDPPRPWVTYEAFSATSTPTAESHPEYSYVIGPFPTKRGAVFYAANGGDPRITVANADGRAAAALSWAAIRDRAKRCPVTGRVNPNWPNPAPWADAT